MGRLMSHCGVLLLLLMSIILSSSAAAFPLSKSDDGGGNKNGGLVGVEVNKKEETTTTTPMSSTAGPVTLTSTPTPPPPPPPSPNTTTTETPSKNSSFVVSMTFTGITEFQKLQDILWNVTGLLTITGSGKFEGYQTELNIKPTIIPNEVNFGKTYKNVIVTLLFKPDKNPTSPTPTPSTATTPASTTTTPTSSSTTTKIPPRPKPKPSNSTRKFLLAICFAILVVLIICLILRIGYNVEWNWERFKTACAVQKSNIKTYWTNCHFRCNICGAWNRRFSPQSPAAHQDYPAGRGISNEEYELFL